MSEQTVDQLQRDGHLDFEAVLLDDSEHLAAPVHATDDEQERSFAPNAGLDGEVEEQFVQFRVVAAGCRHVLQLHELERVQRAPLTRTAARALDLQAWIDSSQIHQRLAVQAACRMDGGLGRVVSIGWLRFEPALGPLLVVEDPALDGNATCDPRQLLDVLTAVREEAYRLGALRRDSDPAADALGA